MFLLLLEFYISQVRLFYLSIFEGTCLAKHKRKAKRGHPLALLIGLDELEANFWLIFSASIQAAKKIAFGKKRSNMDKPLIYKLQKSLVDAIRPFVKEGIKTIIFATHS